MSSPVRPLGVRAEWTPETGVSLTCGPSLCPNRALIMQTRLLLSAPPLGAEWDACESALSGPMAAVAAGRPFKMEVSPAIPLHPAWHCAAPKFGRRRRRVPTAERQIRLARVNGTRKLHSCNELGMLRRSAANGRSNANSTATAKDRSARAYMSESR